MEGLYHFIGLTFDALVIQSINPAVKANIPRTVRSSYSENFDSCIRYSFDLLGLANRSYPATLALPLVGNDRPQSIRMAVVLPAPLAPEIQNFSTFYFKRNGIHRRE